MKRKCFIFYLLFFSFLIYNEIVSQQTLDWVQVPAGGFTYGTNNSIRNLNYDYDIMKYQVTLSQYAKFFNDAIAIDSVSVINNAVMGYYKGDITFLKE